MSYIFQRQIPSEIVQHIYEFCINKRIYWDKVTEQFLKGGFNRKNLKINSYLKTQNWGSKKFWISTRPELSGKVTKWNVLNNKREPCTFDYRCGEWSLKTKQVIVTFKMRRGIWNKWSSKDPVSKWLRNIKKFETAVKEAQKSLAIDYKLKVIYLKYLPKEKNNFGIKFKSQFYKDRAKKMEKEKIKQKEIKRSDAYIQKRMLIKRANSPFVINLTTVNLLFTLSDQNYHRKKFYKGRVINTWFKQHRDVNARLIFTKPRGKNNKYNPDIIDNYIGELQITVRFEDNEIRHYTIENLLLRIQVSKHQMLHRENLENIRKNSKPISNCVLNQQS